MRAPSQREIAARESCEKQIRNPLMMPEVGVTDLVTYHLYHIARYLSRIEGFSKILQRPWAHFVETDLGAFLLAGVGVSDSEMMRQKDLFFIVEWQRFRLLVKKLSENEQVDPAEIEEAFQAICARKGFDPWKGTAAARKAG